MTAKTPATGAATGPAETTRAVHWIGGLDGLRAVAVIAVVLFHLNPGYLSAGFLGVDLFFVISGYLITRLLLAERARDGGIHLGRFYLRRARRLLPAVIVLLAVVGVAGWLLWPDQRPTLPGSMLSSLTYVTNWWMIADQQSYFVAMGRPPMLQHLWSLAIEEQFYLLWAPAVLALTAPWVVRRVLRGRVRPEFAVAAVAGVLALGSTVAMTVIALRTNVPYQADSSRVYFGTDTHAMGLLIGAAAGALTAVPWRSLTRRAPRWVPSAWRATWRPKPLLPAWLVGTDDDAAGGAGASTGRRRGPLSVIWTDAAAVLGLTAVAWMFVAVDEYVPALYLGGFTLFALVAAATIGAVARRGSRVGALLDCRPLAWIGRRSYGIYLWHWPVLVVTRPVFDLQGPEWLIDIARAGLVLVIAALSYRYLETPIREQGAVAWLRTVRSRLVAAARGNVEGAVIPAGAPANVGTRSAAGAVIPAVAPASVTTASAPLPAPRTGPGALHRRLAPGVAATAVFAAVCAAVLVMAGTATPRTDDVAAAEPVPATPLAVPSPAPSSAPILTFPSRAGTEPSSSSASSSAPSRLETSPVPGSAEAAPSADPSLSAVSADPEGGESDTAPPMTEPGDVAASSASSPSVSPSSVSPSSVAGAPAATASAASSSLGVTPTEPPATTTSASSPASKPVAKAPANPPATTTAPTAPASTTAKAPPATTRPAPPQSPAAVSAFGDSVLLGAAPAVKAVTGSLALDAVVGRQAWDTLEAITAAQQAKSLAPVVLIHTGNNGVISPKQLAATLGALKDRARVILLNDHVDRSWQGPNNKTIAAVGAKYPNVVLVDWNAAAVKHPVWFGPDGIHVNGSGAKGYAALIASALG